MLHQTTQITQKVTIIKCAQDTVQPDIQTMLYNEQLSKQTI